MFLDAEFLRAMLRLSTPLLLAGLGGAYMYHAAVPNVAKEGMMLLGAMVAFVVTVQIGNSLLGVIAAIMAACIVALVYAFLVIVLRSDVFAVGFALNIFIAGLITYILRALFHEESTLVSPGLDKLPSLSLGLDSFSPTLATIFDNHSILVPIAFGLVIVTFVVLYRTPYGYWLRATGENPSALQAAGRNPRRVALLSFLLSATYCGMAGAHLATGYLGLFTLSIVAGRGFIALAIVFLAKGRPAIILLASLAFGAADAASPRIPLDVLPPQFSLMLPYLVTIIAMTLAEAARVRKKHISRKLGVEQ